MHFGSPFRSYAKPRGFASVEAMHEAIATAWRQRVAESDTVWVLGDVGHTTILRTLPGTKHLIFGNDDSPRGDYKDPNIFASWANSHILTTTRGPMLLIHSPKAVKQTDMAVLHGHTHAGPDEDDPNFVSVSVDKTGWGPLSIDEVFSRFEARGGIMARARAESSAA